MCEVEIKDESSSNDAGGDINIDMQGTKSHKQTKATSVLPQDGTSTLPNSMATTFDVLNLLRNSSFGTNSTFPNKCNTDEINLLIEMQAKEHAVRMDILRAQLETAKLNRDIAEISKILLLRNLQAHSE